MVDPYIKRTLSGWIHREDILCPGGRVDRGMERGWRRVRSVHSSYGQIATWDFQVGKTNFPKSPNSAIGGLYDSTRHPPSYPPPPLRFPDPPFHPDKLRLISFRVHVFLYVRVLYFVFCMFYTLLSCHNVNFSHGKFELHSTSNPSCNIIALPNPN